MTAFFNSIYSIHIGKQHWEKDGKNAYALNEVPQFNGAPTVPEKQAEPEKSEPEKSEPEKQVASVNVSSTIPELGDTTITFVNDPAVETKVIERADANIKIESSLPASGTMREHLDIILDKIRKSEPFGLIRPSDGERTVMLGETLTNCDNWTFTKGSSLQKDLLEAVKTVDPNLYIGIPCDTCCKPWNCTPAIYKNFIEDFKVPLAQRTFANLFGNSNWQAFADFLKSYDNGFYLVTSGTSASPLKIKERHVISDKLVNTWDTDGLRETQRLLRFIKPKKGELVLFSAGPLSKVWIPKCMQANPTNMYVDVGGSIDIFTKGKTNRFYTNEGHPFAKESCRFSTVA
jgi:hypothetical protein